MGLRDVEATLPPGFRFYPSDEELVCHYLYKKISNEEVLKGTLVEIDLHTCEPWQLPEMAKLNSNEWYFFSFRDRKYATGFRTNRATTCGYWKATGKDRTVLDPASHRIVGMRKTLVFYRNRAPNGIKTGWIMHEYRLETPHMPPKEDWVLCRVFHKSKGEDGNAKLSPQDLMFEATMSLSPLSSPTTTADPTAPCVYHPHPQQMMVPTPPQNNNLNHQTSALNLGFSDHQHQHQFSNHPGKINFAITGFDPKPDHQHEVLNFLWEISMDENNDDHQHQNHPCLGSDEVLPPSTMDISLEEDENLIFLP